jgi:hypothetical protein
VRYVIVGGGALTLFGAGVVAAGMMSTSESVMRSGPPCLVLFFVCCVSWRGAAFAETRVALGIGLAPKTSRKPPG